MKHCLLPIMVILTLFSSCRTPLTPEEKARGKEFTGTISVEYQGSVNDSDNVKVRFLPSEDGTTADITIYRIKFVPKMPVTIDVTIPSVRISGTEDNLILEADNIVPLALGGKYEKYTVYGLEGSQSGRGLEFSLKFGEFPTRFRGRLTEQH